MMLKELFDFIKPVVKEAALNVANPDKIAFGYDAKKLYPVLTAKGYRKVEIILPGNDYKSEFWTTDDSIYVSFLDALTHVVTDYLVEWSADA